MHAPDYIRTIMVGASLWAAVGLTDAKAAELVGHGTASCALWTKDQQDRYFAIINSAWLAGYLSSYSIYIGHDGIRLPDAAAREKWVNNYCLKTRLIRYMTPPIC